MVRSLMLLFCLSMLVGAVGCGGPAGGPVVTDPSEVEKYTTPPGTDTSAESSPS